MLMQIYMGINIYEHDLRSLMFNRTARFTEVNEKEVHANCNLQHAMAHQIHIGRVVSKYY